VCTGTERELYLKMTKKGKIQRVKEEKKTLKVTLFDSV
jgi:hypothetical protein